MTYLIAAYCAFWLILFAYIVSIRSRQTNLEKTVDGLVRRLEEKQA